MRRLLAVALVVLTLAGCSAPEAPTSRPITEAEADRLADVLYTSFQAKGADFALNAVTSGGSTMALNGEIDFVNGAGRATVLSNGSDAAVVQVAWYGDALLESIPALSELATARGDAPFTWVARQIDTETYELDRELNIVIALASTVRENPQLLRQQEVTWVRSDVLRGADVDVFQFGDSTRYWVAVDSSQLLRFEGNNSSGNAPVVVDLTDPGERAVNLPTLEETVSIDAVVDLYEVARAQG